MALRFDQAIIRGEINNSRPGFVTGMLWLLGRSEPVELKLEGNCLRDLAGCILQFSNPRPQADDETAEIIASAQTGAAGDMTASRKARVATVSEEAFMALMDLGEKIPSRLANLLYLEWFSEENGRVVIEATDYEITISSPHWQMDAKQEARQIIENREHFHAYLDAITGDAELEEDEEEFDEETDEEEDENFENEGPPLNEFEWEAELRDHDRRAEAYQEAVDRYKDQPGAERLIAEAMGWDPDSMAEWPLTDEPSLDPHIMEDEFLMGQSHHHPLSRRTTIFALKLQREAEELGLLHQNSEGPVVSMVVSIIALGCKLAAALDPAEEGFETEPGFVIAMLKRAQTPLNEALHALSAISQEKLPRSRKSWLQEVQQELFALRGEMLDIMKDMRSRQ